MMVVNNNDLFERQKLVSSGASKADFCVQLLLPRYQSSFSYRRAI